MLIKHHIRISRKPQLCAELAKLGYSVIPRKSPNSFSVDVDDSDPRWPEVLALAQSHSAWIIDQVEYTPKDVETAEWLFAHSIGDAGYPMPSGDNGYLRRTFDLENYCPRCGVGRVQRDSYRLSSAPSAKALKFFAPQWHHQTIFARLEVRAAFEANGISGLAYLPVVKHRSRLPIEDVVQLLPTTVLAQGLVAEGQEMVTCKPDNEELRSISETSRDPRVSVETAQAIKDVVDAWPRTFTDQTPYCGRFKFHVPYPLRPVHYRPAAFVGAPDVVFSAEWFGSGGAAARQIIFSRKAAQIVMEHRWKGLRLEPIQLLPDACTAPN